MEFKVDHGGVGYVVSFQRLRRTPARVGWFPKKAVSAVVAKVVEATEADAEWPLECTRCAFGLSFLSKSDLKPSKEKKCERSIPSRELGMRIALSRALRVFEDKGLRKAVWDAYLEKFPVEERQ